jgi:hypothetical protein
MNIRAKKLLSLAFKAVALGMAAAAIILLTVNPVAPTLYVTLLSIGLFCLAISSISDRLMT